MSRPTDDSRKLLFIGFFSLLVLVIGFGGWAFMTSISGAIIAPGQIKTVISEQIIQHPDGGVVAQIHVQDGDYVSAGEKIITLDGTLARAEMNTALIQEAELLARAARLEAERNELKEIKFPDQIASAEDPDIQSMLSSQRDIFKARKSAWEKEHSALTQRKMQIEAQIEGARAEQKATQTQLEIMTEEVSNQQILNDKGLSQVSKLNSLKREKAGLEGSVGQLLAQIGQSEEKITEIQTEYERSVLSLHEERATQLREIRTKLLEITEKKITLKDRLARLDIRAPISGTVHGLKVRALQSVITSADALAQIIPAGHDVIVSARVDPINIDEIHPGQSVSLRFSALNQRITPVLFGEVSRISADAFSDQNTGATYYQIEIAPNKGELDRLEGQLVVPGMPVEGYIKTTERTPMSYFVKPFMDYFSRAFRES